MDFFKQVQDGISKIKEEQSIPIPITGKMLQELIKQTDKVKNISIDITDGHISISGETKVNKLFFNRSVSFSIILEPVEIVGRQLHFHIKEFRPLNLKFINDRIFNRPPYLTYSDPMVAIDFNGWESVKRIPFGNIKRYELTDGKITLFIGV